MSVLTAVEPRDLRRWWDQMRNPLRRCLEQDSEDTTHEDIYYAIRAGHATLLVALVDGAFSGFVVLTRHEDPWSGRLTLHIWYAHNLSANIDVAIGEIDEIARGMKASAVTYTANTDSMRRWGERAGFELSTVTMRREV